MCVNWAEVRMTLIKFAFVVLFVEHRKQYWEQLCVFLWVHRHHKNTVRNSAAEILQKLYELHFIAIIDCMHEHYLLAKQNGKQSELVQILINHNHYAWVHIWFHWFNKNKLKNYCTGHWTCVLYFFNAKNRLNYSLTLIDCYYVT